MRMPACMHTLPAAKTNKCCLQCRLQINDGKPIRMGAALRQVLSEGGIIQLYRGGLPEILGACRRGKGAQWRGAVRE